MVLGNKEIEKMCLKNNMIEPFYPKYIQPNSIDIHLGSGFLIQRAQWQPLEFDKEIEYLKIDKDEYILQSKCFCLGTTLEKINLPLGICASVTGRSSVGRMGLAIHITAGHIDSGFSGNITLELYNHSPSPVRLKTGVKIAQLLFYKSIGNTVGYGSKSDCKYQNQSEVIGSKSFLDYK